VPIATVTLPRFSTRLPKPSLPSFWRAFLLHWRAWLRDLLLARRAAVNWCRLTHLYVFAFIAPGPIVCNPFFNISRFTSKAGNPVKPCKSAELTRSKRNARLLIAKKLGRHLLGSCAKTKKSCSIDSFWTLCLTFVSFQTSCLSYIYCI